MSKPTPARPTRQSRAPARKVQEQSAPLTGEAATLRPVLRPTLSAVVRFIDEHRHGPLIRELAEMLDLSHAAAEKHVRLLIAEGFLRRPSSFHRSMEVTQKGKEAAQ